MIPEIKKWSTIEAIKAISSDWPIKPLLSFANKDKNSFVNGPFGSDLLSSELQDTGVPVLYIRDIKSGRYQRKSTVCVSEGKANSLKACQTAYGDVIVSKVGDPPCEAAVYNDELIGIVTQDVIRIKTTSFQNSTFLAYLINSDICKRQVKSIKISGTRERVSLTDFKKLKLPFPSDPEQTKIAQILSTWDKAIETVEKLIENSKQQKKALMQQLLTGKKRFKEFGVPAKDGELPEGWVQSSAGENVDLLSGFAFPSSKYQGSGIKLLRGINITCGALRWREGDIKFWPNARDYEKYILEVNDVVISMDGSLVGRNYSLITKENYEPMLLLQRVARLRCKDRLHHNYLYLHIASPRFENYVDVVKTITAIPHISAKDIRSYPLSLPPFEEQLRIENVLMNAQAEIDLQENKLIKLITEKKALMQQLLTGKRRVKIDTDEPATATA